MREMEEEIRGIAAFDIDGEDSLKDLKRGHGRDGVADILVMRSCVGNLQYPPRVIFVVGDTATACPPVHEAGVQTGIVQ